MPSASGVVRVEEYSGPSEAPCAVVIIEGGNGQVRVARRVDGVETTVRGGRALTLVGGAHIVDYDVPVGRDVVYRVYSGTSIIEAAYRVDSPVGYLMDPYDPSVVATVGVRPDAGVDAVLTASSLVSHSRTARVETAYVIGADVPVAIASGRSRPEQVQMELVTVNADAAERVERVLSSGLVVVRLPPHLPSVDATAYMVCADLQVSLPRARSGNLAYQVFSGSWSHSRPLSRPVVWHLWTLEMVETTWAGNSFAQVEALAMSNGYSLAALERDPRIRGAL